MKDKRLIIIALCLACMALGVLIGALADNGVAGKLQTELQMLRDEKAYVVTSAERDARMLAEKTEMLAAKTEMLDFVSGNLKSMIEVLDTYRTAAYDQSIRIRELEAE